ncbi:hypothetical protein AX17_002916 [Amanita inopinata Kibby_2008]|nr:hypothetical protein AX17_002916 [Amanita inopinata Kibby_2008]
MFTLFCILPLVSCLSYSKHLAWNGHVDPGSTTPAPFTPYYVPLGAKGYESSSPLILYSGEWSHNRSSAHGRDSLYSTDDPGATVSFTFTGTGVEWFGNTDDQHGVALVYIDGTRVKEADNWSDNHEPLKQQRLFYAYNLTYGRHTIKLINTAQRHGSTQRTIMDLSAFVVTRGTNSMQSQHNTIVALDSHTKVSPAKLSRRESMTNAPWNLNQKGATGVSAMQLTVISPMYAIIIDKVEHNPLSISGHPAWAALYNLGTHAVRPLSIQSNSFCAGGSFLGNGTLINVGGNPVVESHTSSADFGDLNGLQAIRIIEPCGTDSGEDCEIREYHDRVRMASPRWYATVVRISDGSALIIGGSKKGGWINNATVNNPTIEYFPPKAIHGSKGLPIHLSFLVRSLNANLFPIAFLLPDGKIFIAANRYATIYDWITNTEFELPDLPNGVRVTYPMAGTGLLLPLSPDNNYEPEILICGGSTIDDRKESYKISSKEPASPQCQRITLTQDGISAGWQVEHMPEARIMPDAVLLPTGEILIVNGAGSGISGYGNVVDQVGGSNADQPVLSPVLYNPRAPPGQRFSKSGMPTSNIPRLYHSVATLTPSGSIMIAGSNPNLDRSELEYGTEYRVEWIEPPYMAKGRPEVLNRVEKIGYGEIVHFKIKLPTELAGSVQDVTVALMDLGFVTHATHSNSRFVYLKVTLQGETLEITGPPNGNIYPPGPGYVFIVINGVPSKAVKVMIGSGQAPSVDEEALANLLRQTSVDQMRDGKKAFDLFMNLLYTAIIDTLHVLYTTASAFSEQRLCARKRKSQESRPSGTMGVTQVALAADSPSATALRKHRNRRKLNKKKESQAKPSNPSTRAIAQIAEGFDDGMNTEEAGQGSISQQISDTGQMGLNGNNDVSADDDALMIDQEGAAIVGGGGVPVFAPLAPGADKSSGALKSETRRLPIPPHRMSPLKKDWVNIFGPLTELLGLQVRMNVQRRCVEIRTSKHTKDIGALQKGADFVKAYALGFDVNDAIALLRLDDLYLDSFEIKDVKTLQGDHLSRAIGRIAGHEGKTKFTIENASRTRIVLADTKIHIMGSFQNIKIARDAIVSLILGSPPGKVYAGLRTVASRMKQRAF